MTETCDIFIFFKFHMQHGYPHEEPQSLYGVIRRRMCDEDAASHGWVVVNGAGGMGLSESE